jgi:hypothetical protein
MVHNNNDGLDYPVSDSTEAVISRTIEGIHRMITFCPASQGEIEEEEELAIKIDPTVKRHWEADIRDQS